MALTSCEDHVWCPDCDGRQQTRPLVVLAPRPPARPPVLVVSLDGDSLYGLYAEGLDLAGVECFVLVNEDPNPDDETDEGGVGAWRLSGDRHILTSLSLDAMAAIDEARSRSAPPTETA